MKDKLKSTENTVGTVENFHNKNRDLAEYARIYYQHQYDRIARLEEQRLIFTNIVIALTAISLTFGYSNIKNITAINGIGLPLVLIALNIFASLYIKVTRKYSKVHRERAKKILKDYAQELYEIDKSIPLPFLGMRLGLGKIQTLLHFALILLSLFPICIYLEIIS